MHLLKRKDYPSTDYRFQFFFDLFGQPMPDQGLIGHRFHGSQLLDGHDLKQVYLDSIGISIFGQ
jgi:hypothetical protein